MLVRFFYLLVFLAGISFGIWLLKGALANVIEASQSTAWPTTTGLVTRSTVGSSTSHGRRVSTSYYPEITYTYTVSEALNTGTVVMPGRHWNYSSSHEAVRLFPQSSRLQIFYSPSNPAQAVLQPGLHVANFPQVVLALLILTFSLPWGPAAIFAVSDGSGKPGRLMFPEGSFWSKIIGWIILAVFIEFFLTWWLFSL